MRVVTVMSGCCALFRVLVLAGLTFVPLGGRAQHTAPVPAASQSLTYELGKDALKVTIRSGSGSPILVRQDGRDVLLSFAEAAPDFDAVAMRSSAAQWLEAISIGYDSLLFRLAPGITVSAMPLGSLVELKFEVSAHPQSISESDSQPLGAGVSATPLDHTGALRLRLLRAQLMLLNQELTQARGRYNSLRTVMPEQFEPIAGLAATEAQAGNWRQSLQYYREAAALKGGDAPALLAGRAEIERTQGNRAGLGFEQRRSHGASLSAPVEVSLIDARAVYRLSEAWRLNLEIDRATVRSNAVQRQNGLITAFSGHRDRGVLSAQHDGLNGATSIASFFLGRSSFGTGVSYRKPDDMGSTSVLLDLRRDNWDYVEGIVDGAQRDRIAIERIQRLMPNLTGTAEIGLNRYYRRNDGNLGRSVSLTGQLRLSRLGGFDGLSAAYSLNGEYFSGQASKVSAAGQAYALLPLVNREVHSLTLGYVARRELGAGSAVTIDAYAGFGSDRYGRSGEIAAVSLAYVRGPVEARLRFNHVKNVSRIPGTSRSISAVITVYF
jgi:hypothetical protein